MGDLLLFYQSWLFFFLHICAYVKAHSQTLFSWQLQIVWPSFFNCSSASLKMKTVCFGLNNYCLFFFIIHFSDWVCMATSLNSKFETCDELAANFVPLICHQEDEDVPISRFVAIDVYLKKKKGKCTLKISKFYKKRKNKSLPLPLLLVCVFLTW